LPSQNTKNTIEDLENATSLQNQID